MRRYVSAAAETGRVWLPALPHFYGQPPESTCTFCGEKSRIDRRLLRYRKALDCPVCGKRVTAVARRKMPRRIQDRKSNVILCPAGLKEALQQTGFAYSGLEAFAEGEKEGKVDISWYLDAWREHPCLEKLAKCGFHILVNDFWYYGRNRIRGLLEERGGRLFEVMKISRGMLSILPKETGSSGLRFVQACCKTGNAGRVQDRDAVLKCLQLQAKEMLERRPETAA